LHEWQKNFLATFLRADADARMLSVEVIQQQLSGASTRNPAWLVNQAQLDAVPVIVKILKRDDSALCEPVANALAAIGNQGAIDVLREGRWADQAKGYCIWDT
jgi:hypothetical protein